MLCIHEHVINVDFRLSKRGGTSMECGTSWLGKYSPQSGWMARARARWPGGDPNHWSVQCRYRSEGGSCTWQSLGRLVTSKQLKITISQFNWKSLGWQAAWLLGYLGICAPSFLHICCLLQICDYNSQVPRWNLPIHHKIVLVYLNPWIFVTAEVPSSHAGAGWC